MFKRENRLVPGIRFNNSYISTSLHFVLKEKKNELNVNRFGIVVSKKIDKRAVVRNKIKRIFRDVLVKLNENIMPGHDILFIIKKEMISQNKKENILMIQSSLEKAGLIKK